MALKDGYRVRQLTTAVGSDITIALTNPPAGFQAFSDIATVNDTFLYSLDDCNGVDWEYGIGVINNLGQLVRDTVIKSSNSNGRIVLSTPPASKAHEVTNGPIPGRATGDVDYAGSMLKAPSITGYTEAVVTATIPVGGVLELNLALGNVFSVLHDKHVTSITIAGVPASGKSASFTLYITQNSTGGWNMAYPAGVRWSSGTAATFINTANKRNKFVFDTIDGGATWDCAYCGAY